MLHSRSRILAEAINTKILTKNYPDSPHSYPDSPHPQPDSLNYSHSEHYHPLFSAFPPWLLAFPPWFPTFPPWLPTFLAFYSFRSAIPHSGFYKYPKKRDSIKGVLLRTLQSFHNIFYVEHPRKSIYIMTIT